MTYTITVTERGATPRGFKRYHGEASKRSWHAVGVRWHSTMRSKHFTRAGFTEYGYAPRSRAYEARKRKKQGHNRPLEFSGESKRRSRFARIAATTKGSTVRFSAPALNLRPKGGRINLREEATRISAREAATLSKVWQERHTIELKAVKAERKTKIT